jgi:Multicopper oxidase
LAIWLCAFLDLRDQEDLAKNIPFHPARPSRPPAVTQEIDVVLGVNSSGNSLFFVNNISFRGNYDNPVLLLAKLGNTSYPDDPQWNVYNFGSNSSIRIIIRNMAQLAHPMHLHGHNFWVLAEGTGTWDGTVVNPRNPPRRDVQIMKGGTSDTPGYLVLEFEADNPGVWPLHCHIAWYVGFSLPTPTQSFDKYFSPGTLALVWPLPYWKIRKPLPAWISRPPSHRLAGTGRNIAGTILLTKSIQGYN